MTTNALPCGANRQLQIADTPDKIKLFQLLSAKHAVLLEQRGLRHSRLGRNGVKRLWSKHWGLHPRASFEDVLSRFNLEINLLKEKLNGQASGNPE